MLLNEAYHIGERMYTKEELKELRAYSDVVLVACPLQIE